MTTSYPVLRRIAELNQTPAPKLTLTFPGCKLDRRVTPNGRVHWTVKHKLLTANKNAGYYNLLALLEGENPIKKTVLPLTITFTRYYSGQAKPFDDDNIRSAWKGYRDGVCKALGIDDNPKCVTGEYLQERCKPGEDRLEISFGID